MGSWFRVSCHLSYLHDITIALNIPLVSTLAERAKEVQDWCVLCCHGIPSSFCIPSHAKSFEFTYLRHFLGPLITRCCLSWDLSIHLFSWSYESLFFGVSGHVFHGVCFSSTAVKYRNPGSSLRNSSSGCLCDGVEEYLKFKTSRGDSHLHSEFIRVVGKTALEILFLRLLCLFLYKYQEMAPK